MAGIERRTKRTGSERPPDERTGVIITAPTLDMRHYYQTLRNGETGIDADLHLAGPMLTDTGISRPEGGIVLAEVGCSPERVTELKKRAQNLPKGEPVDVTVFNTCSTTNERAMPLLPGDYCIVSNEYRPETNESHDSRTIHVIGQTETGDPVRVDAWERIYGLGQAARHYRETTGKLFESQPATIFFATHAKRQ
jgi:hypothetical protein